MPYNEDCDIKLFYPSDDKNGSSEKDILAIAEILDNQRSNGNLLLARKLGEHLASIKPENAGELDGIDLEKGMYTVEEFIKFTKNDFGGDIIRQLEERLT